MRVDRVWNWGGRMNGLRIFPSFFGLIGLIGLSGVVAAMLRRDEDRQAA